MLKKLTDDELSELGRILAGTKFFDYVRAEFEQRIIDTEAATNKCIDILWILDKDDFNLEGML